uniref:Uncharacterized protein n=1 Tax=Lepeophtheirus salmonis TaxID=72036 RepID=A0A0K2TKB3_LEPSM
MDHVYNRRNHRWLEGSPEEVEGVFCTKHPAQTMARESLRPTARRCLSSFVRLGRKSAKRSTTRCSGSPYCHGSRPTTQRTSMYGLKMVNPHTSAKCQKFCTNNMETHK